MSKVTLQRPFPTQFGGTQMIQMSLESASANLGKLFQVATEGDGVHIIDTNGKELGVLLSRAQFNAIQIRLDLASNPERLAQVIDAHRRFQSGDMDSFEDYKFD